MPGAVFAHFCSFPSKTGTTVPMSKVHRPPERRLAFAAFVGVLCLSQSLAAQEAPVSSAAEAPAAGFEAWADPSAPQEHDAAQAPPPLRLRGPDDVRETPDFDGRGPEPLSALDKALWIPRVALAPFYFLAEYVIRRPLSVIVPAVEEAELIDRLGAIFRFGPNDNFFLIPTFAYDFGFRPNVGAYFRWKQALHEDNSIRLQGSFGGTDWYRVSLTDRFQADDFTISARLNYTRRGDGSFWGTGAGANSDRIGAFDWEGADASIGISTRFWRQSNLSVTTGVRRRRFGNDADGITIEERVAAGAYELPAGFEGYTAHFTRGVINIDSRRKRPAPGSGVRFRSSAEVAYDLETGVSNSLWVILGGALDGFWDITGNQHVLSLSVGTALAENLAGDVPFVELPRLSGNGPMQGFAGGFLVGESHLYATVRYRWPIWVLLDGHLHASIGNVFGHRYEGFEFDRLRMSFGVGISAVDRTDHFFELMLGFGTETFEQGARLEATRFFFGGTRAF